MTDLVQKRRLNKQKKGRKLAGGDIGLGAKPRCTPVNIWDVEKPTQKAPT